jgi:Glycosyl hydrolase family 14
MSFPSVSCSRFDVWYLWALVSRRCKHAQEHCHAHCACVHRTRNLPGMHCAVCNSQPQPLFSPCVWRMQAYTDFVSAFVDEFNDMVGVTITEVTVGMGPAGELRYPSYPEGDGRWRFPGVGQFQCYDRYMGASLAAAADAVGRPEWCAPVATVSDNAVCCVLRVPAALLQLLLGRVARGGGGRDRAALMVPLWPLWSAALCESHEVHAILFFSRAP